MIERLEGMPDNVVGLKAVGEVTADDYDAVIVPAVQDVIEREGKARLVYVLGEEFEGWTAGALWDDAKLGASNVRAWERVAVVTDREWIEKAVKLFGWMVPGEVKLFQPSELDAAAAWATGGG